jgi:hypothetical protein
MSTKKYVLKIQQPPKAKLSGSILTTSEFCDDPLPKVIFEGSSFCFTGIFQHENGNRLKCEEAVRMRGGFVAHGQLKPQTIWFLELTQTALGLSQHMEKRFNPLSNGNWLVQTVK